MLSRAAIGGSNPFTDVKSHGAKGDGRIAVDGSTSAGQPTVTSPTLAFTSADRGKTVVVCTDYNDTATRTMVGTIQSVAAGVATLDVNAPATDSGLVVVVGTDDTTAFQAAADAVQDNAYLGGKIEIGPGVFVVTGTVVLNPAPMYDTYGPGGIELVGDSASGTMIVLAATDHPLLAVGTDTTTAGSTTETASVLRFADFTLLGPGEINVGTVGIDKRLTGGSIEYDNVFVRGFEIGVRHHDAFAVTARQLMTRECDIGKAFGFANDGHSLIDCRADYCRIGHYWGYTDSARSEAEANNYWHANSVIGGFLNDNDVSVYIEGNSGGTLSYRDTYMEQWADVAVRIGDSAGAHGVPGTVKFDNCRWNGNRTLTNKYGGAGRIAHAIEVNQAYNVVIDGLNVDNTSDAPVNIRNTNATVEVRPGYVVYNAGDAVQGEVLLPDSTYVRLNIAGNNAYRKSFTYGRRTPSPVSYVVSLPTATADWAGARLRLYGTRVEYICESTDGTTWAWNPVPSAAKLTSAGAGKFMLDPYSPSAAVAQTTSRSQTLTGTGILSTGRLTLALIYLEAGTVVNSITFISGGTALATGTHQWFALYDLARNKLAVTSDDTSTAWAANTVKTLSLSAAYTVPTTGLYYLGVMVAATTVPNIICATPSAMSAAQPPILCGSADSGLTDPASAPAAAAGLSGLGAHPFAWVA